MSKTLFVLFIVCSLAPLTGCVEEFDLNELNGSTSNRLVIEGLITNEMKQHAIILTRVNLAIPDTESEKISGANVEITDGTNVFILNENISLPGIYQTEDNVKGEVGKTYTLKVSVDGENYTASAFMEAVTPFEPVEKLFESPNRIGNPIRDNFDVFDLSFPKVLYGADVPSKQVLLAYDSIDNRLLNAVYYEFPRIDPQGFLLNFSGANPTLILVPGSTVVQFKFSMSEVHYEFVRAIYAETKFKGGIFDSVPGNAPSNISNNGLGFFAASAVINRVFTVTESNLTQ